jgi:integrase
MAKSISERVVAALAPPPSGNRRYHFPGAVLSGRVAPGGFVVRVTKNGVVSFCLDYRGHLHTIGRWDKSPGGGDTSLARGIIRAKELAASLAAGADPRPVRTRKIAEAAAPKGETVGSVIDRYLDRMRKDRPDFRTINDVARILARVKEILGNHPAHELRRADVADALDTIADTGTRLMADRSFFLFQACWRWASDRDERLGWPFTKGMRRVKPQPRTRILSDDELARVWAATSDGSPYSRYMRFLLTTAARRAEAMLPWDELDATRGVWSLPASRNKIKADLARPLSKIALSQLVMNGEPCAFSFTNGAVTRQLSALLKRSGTTGWRLHDLRRTARSLMSRAGVPGEHAERCLGHVAPIIQRTYDRHTFDLEMRTAYEKLATLIEQIVNPQPNVVTMARGR